MCDIRAHLADQLNGFHPLLFEEITAHTADQVGSVSFTGTGQQFGHGHGFFTHTEELHKAGIKTGKVAGEPDIQQVAVQTLHFQQYAADGMRTLRHIDTQRVFHGCGVRHAVGKAADTAHAVRQESDFVIPHTGFRQFFHAAVDVEHAVVRIDNPLSVNEQTEVARFIRGDVQRADWHNARIFFAVVDKLVSLGIGGRCRTLTVIHGVFAQRIEIIRPVIRQHQTAFIRQTHRTQPVHITDLTLAPHRRRHARCDRREFLGDRADIRLHGDPAFFTLFHRECIVNRELTVQRTLIVTPQHRQPAAAAVVQKLHHLRQHLCFDSDGQLIGGLPLFFQHRMGKFLADLCQIARAFTNALKGICIILIAHVLFLLR